MTYKKENLVKLLKLVFEISMQPGNEWFKNEIIKNLNNNFNESPKKFTASNNTLFEDIRRTKLFLKNIDKRYYLEGFHFYKKIKDTNLRKKLIEDYKEMKIALSQNDILEYARRKSIQLERCFDFIIEKTNGWEVVKSNPDLYTEICVPSGNFDQKFRIKDNFFKVDINNKDQKIKKEISEIEFKSKAVYCFVYYQFDFTRFFSSFNDIYFLRNKASHGSLSLKDKNRIEKLNSKFSEQSLYYNKMFQFYIESLKGLFE